MRALLGFIVLSTVSLSSIYSSEKNSVSDQLKAPVEKVFSLADMNEKTTQEFFNGNLPDMVIECKKGTALPMRYLGDFKLFSVNFAPNVLIQLEENCYLRVINKKKPEQKKSKAVKAYISFDCKRLI